MLKSIFFNIPFISTLLKCFYAMEGISALDKKNKSMKLYFYIYEKQNKKKIE